MRRHFPGSTFLIFTISILILGSPTPAIARTQKPTLAQIEAAKEAEVEKRRKANAASGKLDKARSTLKQLTSLTNSARARYILAQNELAIATKAASLAAVHAAVASAAVSATHKEIGKLAINAYMMGGGLTDIESVLSANGPQEVIDQMSMLHNLGSGNRTALRRFKKAEQITKLAEVEAEKTKQYQLMAAIKVSTAKKAAEDAQNEQEQEVKRLQTVQDGLLKDLASAKRVRITLEQKRQLALLEEAQANRAARTKGQSKLWKSDGTTGRVTIRTNEAQRAKAVEFARRQVLANKPYVWGNEGPNSFDCSGLVYAAYKYAGLGWPNWDRLNAALYYSYTKHVALSQMQPGDLLFYSYDGNSKNIHHMSIYAGNDMAWEARSTKTGLRYSSIYSVEGMMPFAGRV